jgi:hypothetical protein
MCSLLGSCVALCLLSRCRLHPVLLGVAPSRSVPTQGAAVKALIGQGVVPDLVFFQNHSNQELCLEDIVLATVNTAICRVCTPLKKESGIRSQPARF